MQRTICAGIVLFAIAALPLSHLLMAGQERVWVCHVTFPNNTGHAIQVSTNALEVHLSHGDRGPLTGGGNKQDTAASALENSKHE